MPVINDLQDRAARLAVPYGLHAVRGHLVNHRVETVGTETQITIKQAVGQGMWLDRATNTYHGGGWHSLEKLFYGGDEISSDNYEFRAGTDSDAPSLYFPNDIPHPGGAHYNARLPRGIAEEGDLGKMFGIFKTLETAEYDGAGVQTGFGYSANPARHLADLRLRARRSPLYVNWESWVDWRDMCAEQIDWDDGALTPHYVSLQASAGGSLAPGTYWVKIATLKGADISSASKDRANDGITTAKVVISGGNLQFTVTWASQIERGATGYRVYIGTSEGGQDRFFTVADGNTNTLLVTTLAGASMGEPPTMPTGSLLRQISRFESHLFMPPPFDLPTAVDRIAQITCMDFAYVGGKQVYTVPGERTPVFELDVAQIKGFRTYQVERRQRYNQIVVNFRDLDQWDLRPAKPVIVDRPTLQEAEGPRTFEINGGCMYRSQANRVGHYWARRLIDSDQIIDGEASPRSYIVVPGDVTWLSHDVPNWTDEKICWELKDEDDSKAGYPFVGRSYPDSGDYYSDTDTEPLPRPYPPASLSVFSPPPIVISVTPTQEGRIQPNGTAVLLIIGAVQFAAHEAGAKQRGRVWWRNPTEEKAFTADAGTNVITAASHGFADGTPIGVRNSGGALPSPLSNTTTYFVRDVTTNTFKLALTLDGAAIDITTAGTGTHYVAAFKQVMTIVPHSETLQAAFELIASVTGIHQVKVVSESELGVAISFEQHATYELTVAVRSSVLRIAEPVVVRSSDNGLGFYAGLFPGPGSDLWLGTDLHRDRQTGAGYEFAGRATTPATGGVTTNTLGGYFFDFDTTVFDTVHTVRVAFDGPNGPPANCTVEEARDGRNKIIIGNPMGGYEVVNATTFTLVSGVTYDVTGFWRGREGTEFAVGIHGAGDIFLLVNDALLFIAATEDDLGQAVNLKAVSLGQSIANVASQALTLEGNTLKPLAVADVISYRDSAGNMGWRCMQRVNARAFPNLFLAEFLNDGQTEVLFSMLFQEGVLLPALLKAITPGVLTDKNSLTSSSTSEGSARSFQSIETGDNIIEGTLTAGGFSTSTLGVITTMGIGFNDAHFRITAERVNISGSFFSAAYAFAYGTLLGTIDLGSAAIKALRVRIEFINNRALFFYFNNATDEQGYVLFAESAIEPNFPYNVFANVNYVTSESSVKEIRLTDDPFPSAVLTTGQQTQYLGGVKAAIPTRIRQYSGNPRIGYGFPRTEIL